MRFPVVSGRDAEKAFQRLGFHFERQVGSHRILVRIEPFGMASIPMHGEVKRGTLLGILRKAGVSREEFLRELR